MMQVMVDVKHVTYGLIITEHMRKTEKLPLQIQKDGSVTAVILEYAKTQEAKNTKKNCDPQIAHIKKMIILNLTAKLICQTLINKKHI